MEYKILRGDNQIGGNIIKVSTCTTKILLDIGLELDDEKNTILPDIDGLFNSKGYDAVFITHYHSDHMGLVYRIYKDIPIYMGERCFRIIEASDYYKGKNTVNPTGFCENKKPILVGDLRITPYVCDHSAADSYMFFVEGDGDSILYTGDFRSTGRMTKDFNQFLESLPKNPGTLLCEGTTLSRKDYVAETEHSLEEKITEALAKYSGPVFVLQSSMNIDRIVTMYKAARKNKRLFLEDLYLAQITEAIGGHVPRPLAFDHVKAFVTRYYKKGEPRQAMYERYIGKRIGMKSIAESHFMMCVRTSMLNYLRALNKLMSFEEGLLIYSFWSGYKEKEEMRLFLSACKEMGLSIQTFHIGGHADAKTIDALIDCLNPKHTQPVHTLNPEWFQNK